MNKKPKTAAAPETTKVPAAEQANLDITTAAASGPVECLGSTFPSDAARQEHFLKELAKKLKDPAFRKIEGFPIGEDEDILALSDPPYYTACPNPWLADFVTHYGRPYTSKEKYHREPFAADVTEGKTHPLYKAHAYYTKVPHQAIVPAILHYTQPGDIVLDAFCGTGMTGLAVQWANNPGPEYREEVEARWKSESRGIPLWGPRRVVLNDLSPHATFISANYNLTLPLDAFDATARALLAACERELGWMYETRHKGSELKARIEYTVWSEVYACPECAKEVVFLEQALDNETNRVKSEFNCPHCAAAVTKARLTQLSETVYDPALLTSIKRPKRKPVLIAYKANGKRYEKQPDADDLALIARIEQEPFPTTVPVTAFPFDEMWEAPRLRQRGITHIHHLFLKRPLITLGFLWQKAEAVGDRRIGNMIKFMIEQAIRNMSIMNSYEPLAFSQNARGQKSAYYVPGQHSEIAPWYFFDGKRKALGRAFSATDCQSGLVGVTTGSVTAIPIPDQSVDYIFTDPPFGDNFPYAELNFMVESWYRLKTETTQETVVDRGKKNKESQKDLPQYQHLMLKAFQEYNRVLKPGRWMTVVFSNTKASVWNCIQTTLQEAGFVVANVSALDKQQRSFKAVTTPTAVKQDLVISAYKPNGGLEDRFGKTGQTEAGVWDFITTHLANLPVVKPKGGQLEPIAERDARILFDRTVAFYVRHGIPVPISSPEFQTGLAERFPERDGMYFLSDQAAEYDKVRMKMEGIGQLTIFVEDERSAVDWLRNYLKNKPSKYQDIQPEFFEQLNQSWKKWETKPELRAILDQYFLCYQGEGDVPPQIHSYLSTNFKELRILSADHAMLRAKARDRWFVPDPRKNADVEQLREKHLLVEFWSYLPPGYEAAARTRKPNEPVLPGMQQPPPKLPKGKRIAIVRTEAVRVGFNFCFARNDYVTIIAVAQHIPDDVIHNDEQLQMIYDSAVTRTGGDAE